MGLRLRKDGTLVCAAQFPEEPGDVYISHNEHYEMAVKGLVKTKDGSVWEFQETEQKE